jgi:hypothetical protein
VVVTGCATARVSQSQISAIVVYNKGDVVPSDCAIIRSATARDGVESDGLVDAKVGSRDRVLQRLKKQAASLAGNALAIQDEAGPLCVDCSGSVVEIRADLLKCGHLGTPAFLRSPHSLTHRTDNALPFSPSCG